MELKNIWKRTDLIFAIFLIAILSVLLFPMPSWMLDLSLSASFSFSVLILMVALFAKRPLDFNIFPTILLIAAMMRLSLNVASTRLILSYGNEGAGAAGRVIEAFGNFVMGGNFIIGLVIFIILIIINFIVITKGSGRISEVTARFTLDSMPGKQMAIDADLNAGLINEETAKLRRKELEEESNFYGAMDGASKFVRGDAVAGLLITGINILGGILIGIFQMNMDLQLAINNYILLTVGDGLVSQIPALIVSTSAGLLISKAGLSEKTDKVFFMQLGRHPKALGISAFLLGIMGILPGLPAVPFMSAALIMGAAAYWINKKQEKEVIEKSEAVEKEEISKEQAEQFAFNPEPMDELCIQLGSNLLPFISIESEADLGNQLNIIRKQVLYEYGFIVPSIRIKDNPELNENQYAIYIKNVLVSKSKIYIDKVMLMSPDGLPIKFDGLETVDAAFNLPVVWVDHSEKNNAILDGYTVIDAQSALITHFAEVLKEHMSELMTSDRVQELIDSMDERQKKVFSDLIPSQIPLNTVQLVLQNLLSERVSIRDFICILDAICQASRTSENIIFITEYVRSKLSRQISTSLLDQEGNLGVVMLSSDWEDAFSSSLIGEDDKTLAMEPTLLQDFVNQLQDLYNTLNKKGMNPALLSSGTIRPYVRSIIDRVRPNVFVMSHQEVYHRIGIQTHGQL